MRILKLFFAIFLFACAPISDHGVPSFFKSTKYAVIGFND